jgi:lipoate-protein ligase A
MAAFESIVTPEPIAGSAADDHALSRELMERVAAGELPGAMRIWRPVPALALTRLDERRPGAARAVTAAEHAGLPVVRRMSGGYAVVLGPGSLCVGVAEPARTFEGTSERYIRFGDAIVAALGSVGVDAEQGAVEGEWCPGAWSIRSGAVKLAGVAQRAVRHAAWVEAVIELAPDPVARAVLPEVYAALELPLDLATLGSVEEVAGRAVSFSELAGALAHRLRA